MGGRWTTYQTYFAFLIIILEINRCWSLNTEGIALLQFRAMMESDPFGALSDWDLNDHNPCMWSGIYCLNGIVHKLDLGGLNLKGKLPAELGSLTHLQFLDLSKNQLYGIIPPQFGLLERLKLLDLRENNLTGTIPAELAGLQSLKCLLLNDNKFEGIIPANMRKLYLLTELKFDKTLTPQPAETGCINRKLGRCMNKNLRAARTVEKQVNTLRRILAEQSSSNLAALSPPNSGALSTSEVFFPSRSSGSFPAMSNQDIAIPKPAQSRGYESRGTPTNQADVSANNGKYWGELKIILGISIATFMFIVGAVLFLIFRSRAVKVVRPWKTGLSGPLQKAFIKGVPNLNRDELEVACEDFSNIISTYDGVATIYKGTLSSGVEIAVASTAVSSLKDWSKRAELAYRKKINSLSRVNHKNFVNLIGYCKEDEPFTRMMVFEYAPNGALFEHLHVEEVEHIDWNKRMRVIMGTAYCLQYMHNLNPPVAHFNLTSNEIHLTDDYAAKIADISFWVELITKAKQKTETESESSEVLPFADTETNVYSFGVLLLEIISGKHTYSEEHGHLINWAAQYLNNKKTFSYLIDPALKSFKDNELDIVCEVIEECTQQDAQKRPNMKEVVQKLRQSLDISPDAATPRLSPLWWAELEILSAEAA